MSSAAPICRIRSSLSLPGRSTSVPTDTLSTESRSTTEASGIGSSGGSIATSVGSPRMVVVHGPTGAAADARSRHRERARRPATDVA
jgi:hypothetical protein